MAGLLWGSIGIYVAVFDAKGLSSLQIVGIRVLTAGVILLLYLLLFRRDLLRVQWKDSGYFIGTGIISIVFFNWFLFQAMQETSIAVSTVLLYTAPAFVTILARVCFKEALTGKKIIALFLTLMGCILVVDIFPLTSRSISGYGMLLGVCSGFFYGLYSIFSKLALKTFLR